MNLKLLNPVSMSDEVILRGDMMLVKCGLDLLTVYIMLALSDYNSFVASTYLVIHINMLLYMS